MIEKKELRINKDLGMRQEDFRTYSVYIDHLVSKVYTTAFLPKSYILKSLKQKGHFLRNSLFVNLISLNYSLINRFEVLPVSLLTSTK